MFIDDLTGKAKLSPNYFLLSKRQPAGVQIDPT